MTRPEDKTVLVVDDEQDVRDFLATVLEDGGFNVVTAADGAEALKQVEARAPDFISLDLVMPNKSGMRFLHDIRRKQEWRDIPVVVVTAHAHDDLGREDFQEIFSGKGVSGPRFYLEKPVNPAQYVRLVCETLGLETTEESEGSDAERLRRELQELVDKADAPTLAQMLRLLKSLT